MDLLFSSVIVSSISIAERHLSAVIGDEPVIGNRYTMCITTQVVQQFSWASEGSLAEDHPGFSGKPTLQPTFDSNFLGMSSRSIKLARIKQFLETGQELPPEHFAQRSYREQELVSPGAPT